MGFAGERPEWVHRARTISGTFAIAGIAPFLAFFLLIRKESIYLHFSSVFAGKIDTALFIARVKRMVRGYVLGNLVAGTLMSAATAIVFLLVGVHSALPLGLTCGFLNMIPFIGGILAAGVALAAGILQFDSIEPLVAIALLISILHLIAVNYVIPRIVGPRLLIGPVTTTVGMLFWGWLWGIMGLLLAVPLTASIKLVADSHPRLDWLSKIMAHGPEPVPGWIPISGHALQRIRLAFQRMFAKHAKRGG